jgi:hypothetical protein
MAYTPGTLEIKGIQETLKTLKDVEPDYAKTIRKEIRVAATPILISARSLVPAAPPLSGMARGSLIKGRDGTKWDSSLVVTGFKILTNRSGRKERTIQKQFSNIKISARPYNLLTLRQNNAAGAIWDHAGAKTKGAFVTNLEMTGTVQPRAAEPGVEAARPAVEGAVTDIVKKVMARSNKEMRSRRGN